MSDGTPKFQGQIISRKAKAIDVQQPTRKKNKKNRRRDQDDDQHKQQLQHVNQQPRNSLIHIPKNHKNQNTRVFEEVSSICSTYKPATIRSILEDCSYDKEEALNRLFDMKPDAEEKEEEEWSKDLEKVETQSGDTSHPSSEIANNLMNEVFDNFLQQEINGRQFEELFEQIAEMIKDDQESGLGVLQINSFVDECNSIKQTLLVGFREELSNFDDFHFDQSYPLYAQTQEFLYEQINKQVQQEKRREEDFPTLGSARSNKRNIVDRIRQEQRKKKQETTILFTPSKNSVPQFARERNNQLSIFNVDNKLKSEKDMLSLHKQFSDMPIQDLKFVYKTFVGDYNICREFLIKYYDSKRNNRIYEVNRPNSLPRQPSRRVYASRLSREKVDEQLKHLSLQQLREEIDHLYKLKQALQLTKMKIRGSSQKVELDRMINEKSLVIGKLSQASRLLQVQRMASTNPLYIDLHGYRQEQIFPLMSLIVDMIIDEYDRGNEKIRVKKIKGRQTVCLTVMTGKGLHSQGNRSILKPTVLDWCKDRDFDCEEGKDHLRVFVGVER